MSDIFFSNIDEAPVPPAEVRIRSLTAQPRRDRFRLRFAEVTNVLYNG